MSRGVGGSRPDGQPATANGPEEGTCVVDSLQPSHVIDSRLLGRLFSSAEMAAVFTDRAMVQSWLDAEVGLSAAQAELGLIPAAAAVAIAAAADADDFDLDVLGAEIQRTAHPLVPVVRQLAEAAGPDAGGYVHYGATTQDITDTGLTLQLRVAIGIIERLVADLTGVLADRAEQHRDQPMVGRTHAQHALPITLGFKFAVLAAECERHLARLADLRPRVLQGQLGGAVGSLAAFGAHGPAVQERMMARLGLDNAIVPWHTARDGFAELVCVTAMIAATCGKIANEVRVLQRSEVAEVEEPFELGKVGSSTMPHKRNPMYSEYVIAGAVLCRQAPGHMLAAMHQEHERDMGLWGVDWAVLPETMCRAAGMLEHTAWIVRGLVVHPEAMHRNLHLLGDIMLSEAAMMHIAGQLGKTTAHEVVYQAAMRAWDTGRSLRDTLADSDEVSFTAEQLDELAELLVPETYLGSCRELVDRTVVSVRKSLERTVGPEGVH
jgi:3-carboxy-cis,cis-muconate cycloisomerase